MSFYTRAGLQRDFAQQRWQFYGRAAEAVLSESVAKAAASASFDVFLSHSYLDAADILALKTDLEGRKLSVYVDWLEDQQLDRSKVTPATAQALKSRMRQCRSLFYAASESAAHSKWMPWELGHFDALRGKVAIVPILDRDPGTDSYKGQEYLGLYPYVVKTGETLYVHRDVSRYQTFDSWLTNPQI